MTRIVTIGRWLLGAVAAAVLASGGAVYIASERMLRRAEEGPLPALQLAAAPESLERGRRLATFAGCYAGCHGDTVEGEVWSDSWLTARLTAPNLTQVMHEYGDAEFVRLMRNGVRRDGTTAFVMPAVQFRHFTDADLGALAAFLRSLPPAEGPPYRRSLGPLGRLGLLTGEVYPSADDVDPDVPPAGSTPPATPLERGRYLAMTGCPECHGPGLDGWPGDAAPPLAIVAAYGRDEFHTLLRTGLAKGGREVGLMSRVARVRMTVLTDDEVDELYDYLRVRAGLSPEAP